MGFDALEKPTQLREGGDSFDWFFLAMAYWQLGQKEMARQWFDHVVAWMKQHEPTDEELLRFHAEAASLLSGAPSND